VPLPALLAKADATRGAASAKKCQSCHDFTEGGPNKIGPNLYGVVGRPIASHPGYSYTDALTQHAKENWTYEALNKWLLSPKADMPGTKMTFTGIPDDAERADVLAYLQTLSHSPVPFPAAEAAPAGAAPAAGDKAAPAAATPAPAPAAATPAPAAATPAPAAAAPATPAPAATTPAK